MTTPAMLSPLGRLGAFVARRRGYVLLACLAALVVAFGSYLAFKGTFTSNYATPGSDSQQLATLLRDRFPGQSGDTITVVWTATNGVRAPTIERRVDGFLLGARTVPGIGAVGQTRVAPDGRVATTELSLDRPSFQVPTASGSALIARARSASGAGLHIELEGSLIENAEGGGAGPGVYGLIIAAIILVVAFGSLVAAGLPIAVALFGLGVSTALGGILAAFVAVPSWAPAVASLLGIGVGVDYALLVLTRFRSALAREQPTEAAVVEAMSTAGRSVLVAGSTVLISLLGLFAIGVPYLRGVALATCLAVLVMMIGSITVLPALLAAFGHRVDRLRVPLMRRAMARAGDTHAHSAVAERWVTMVQRRPWLAAAAAIAILLALAVPALNLRLGFSDAGNDRVGTTTRAAYDLTASGFGPGANGPLIVGADLRAVRARSQVTAQVASGLHATTGVTFVSSPRFDRAGDAVVFTVIPQSSPQSARTQDLVTQLRNEVLRPIADSSRARVFVGGETAAAIDQSALISARLPLFVAVVLSMSFALLLVAFRAPVIALKAGIMNLLSIGAAYGVVTLAADGGWFGRLIGIDNPTPVAPFIPVMMFAILFGLSMDYEVFLLSRIREEYVSRRDTRPAVTLGIAKTARVITAAAAIMVGVFLAFLTSQESFLKLLGIGMATAVLVDATIVRLALVPAIMRLLNDRNWWTPRWLHRALTRGGAGAATGPALMVRSDADTSPDL